MTRSAQRYPQIRAFKRGGFFSYSSPVMLPATAYAWQARAQVVDAAGNRTTLTMTLTPFSQAQADGSTHALLLECAGSTTQGWSVGEALCDVVFTETGGASPAVWPSPTFSIEVVDRITEPD